MAATSSVLGTLAILRLAGPASTYFLDGALIVAHAILGGVWEGSSAQWRYLEISDVLGLIVFAGLAALGTWKDVNGVEVWTRTRVKIFALLALAVDITQMALLATSISFLNEDADGPLKRLNLPNTTHFGLVVLRVIFLLILTVGLYYPRVSYLPASRNVEEANPSTGLLQPSTSSQYGTFTPHSITRTHTPSPLDGTPSSANPQVNPPKPSAPGPLKPSKEINEDPSWRELAQRLSKLAPYLWPKKDKGLQFLAGLCIVLLGIGRIVNLLLPITLGEVVSALEQHSSPTSGPLSSTLWPALIVYVVLRFLQSPGGLPALRDTLWAPVMQYSDREMSQLSFDHLLNLSLAFHTRRKTGEVLRILDRGASINHILELLLFNIGPIFLDAIVALVFFFYLFGWPLAAVIFAVMTAYVYASVILTKWRTKLRRRMNERDVISRGIHTDCLLNYETVKYFNGEQHEGQRYQDAIRQYQALEYRVMSPVVKPVKLGAKPNFCTKLSRWLLHPLISAGVLVGSLLVAFQILDGKLDVNGVPMTSSHFIVFITYLAQLYGPLNSLGYIYRAINQNLVDTERLMKLLDEPPEVQDKPNAPDLEVTTGEIEFDNVNFSYDGRVRALNGVSFTVPKGSSVALVGESGSGKSTILRLLYRFYDLKDGEGRILIDGQDIREVTQQSLRRAIGVVPQDSVLFNASIAYNIGYGRFGATPTEIQVAAQAAQMHERVLSFPDGYDTTVGERGVRLSGGEKQRVAIARTLLKNPPILLLDEATSALDTSTEKDIQKALQNLVKGRSSLSIAHRLSTIAAADIILVLKDGQIVESGNFRDLLAQGGVFAAMWEDQVSAEEAAEIVNKSDIHNQNVSGYVVNESENQLLRAGEEGERQSESQLIATEARTISVVPPNLEDPFADPYPIIESAHMIVNQSTTDSPQFVQDSLPDESITKVGSPEQLVDLSVEEPSLGVSQDRPMISDVSSSANGNITDKPSPAVAFPSSQDTERDVNEYESTPILSPRPQVNSGPLAFPSGDSEVTQSAPATPAPIGFPGVSSAGSVVHQHQSVTFSSGIATPPRSGTPDPEGRVPKRIRKTSQNIQKFARSLSLAGRRQSTGANITKVEGVNSTGGVNTPRSSREDSSSVTRANVPTGGEGSIGGDSGSSVGLDREDKDKESKKGKKLKSKKNTK
ncbi:hypothetical protein Clacol_000473 [Clathrus columnatus]|uniref:Uncharacterized protein n=1 Tax=Clathrus columnatus TaxID=1419009 RepID=A0AAV4ZYT9_9AGAM|nr:hypothetical protein Clacol_000473 [Clathrus columnatus]